MSEEARPAKVVLADDHAVVREGLRLLLERTEGLEVAAEAGTVDDVRRMVRAHRPDALVLDLNMGGESALGAIPDLLKDSPGTRIVVLTMQDDPAFAREALQHGAAGYVLKDAASAELVEALQTVLAGDTYLNPRLGARLAAAPAPEERPDDLTEREEEILTLIARGHTNREIADSLYLSVRTVESHRAHIQQKLRRTTRAELVQYAIDRGLVS